jgi:hypothetical protein
VSQLRQHERLQLIQAGSLSTQVGVRDMAKNTGSGHRIGAVKDRAQTTTSSGNSVKRDTKTGRFMDVKSDKAPFKGVRKEK